MDFSDFSMLSHTQKGEKNEQPKTSFDRSFDYRNRECSLDDSEDKSSVSNTLWVLSFISSHAIHILCLASYNKRFFDFYQTLRCFSKPWFLANCLETNRGQFDPNTIDVRKIRTAFPKTLHAHSWPLIRKSQNSRRNKWLKQRFNAQLVEGPSQHDEQMQTNGF